MSANLASRRLASSSRASASYLEIWRFANGAQATRSPRQCLAACSPSFRRRFHVGRRLADVQEQQQRPGSSELLSQYKTSLNFQPATHEIRELDDPALDGREVVIHGYLGARRDAGKKLCFWHLTSRDFRHSVQIVSVAGRPNEELSSLHGELKRQHPGTPVVIKGRMKGRKPANEGLQDGVMHHVQTLEVELESFELLNTMPKDVLMTRDAVYPPEQRHLHMRQNASVREALAFRSRVARTCRNCLEDGFGFSEIETPLLFKSTPEGAREFLVPTRRRAVDGADVDGGDKAVASGPLAYALPQSPQQFKQVLMGSGISRYYQLARCFRDEDLRADRQPEFTQLDLEMSFAGGDEVKHVITTLVRKLWKDLLLVELPETFENMKYEDAMAKYGSDKPDVRLGMELSRVDYLLPADLVSKISSLPFPAVDAMHVRFDTPTSPSESRKFITSFLDHPDSAVFHSNPAGGPGVFVIDSSKPLSGMQPLGWEAAENLERMYGLEDGDILILQARPDEPFSGGSTPLGNLRLALHRAAVQEELINPPQGFAPLWITDFPLFTPISSSNADADAEPGQGGTAGLASTHHPFTSPKTPSDVDLLLTNPSSVIGEHYDLVVNGIELGGGSRRIHNADVQRLIMEQVLRMQPSRVADFDHLLAVLRTGCPPHAGIALGFDRLVALMLGRQSVRDVIAFPKTGSGEDPLMKSPGVVSAERLAEYHLRGV